MKSISSIYFKTVFYPDSPQRGRSDFSKSEGNHTLEDKQASTQHYSSPLPWVQQSITQVQHGQVAEWPSSQPPEASAQCHLVSTTPLPPYAPARKRNSKDIVQTSEALHT